MPDIRDQKFTNSHSTSTSKGSLLPPPLFIQNPLKTKVAVPKDTLQDSNEAVEHDTGSVYFESMVKHPDNAEQIFKQEIEDAIRSPIPALGSLKTTHGSPNMKPRYRLVIDTEGKRSLVLEQTTDTPMNNMVQSMYPSFVTFQNSRNQVSTTNGDQRGHVNEKRLIQHYTNNGCTLASGHCYGKFDASNCGHLYNRNEASTVGELENICDFVVVDADKIEDEWVEI